MRRKIVAANWKMNLTHNEVKPYLDRFLTEVGEVSDVQIVFIPSFTSIPALADALEKSPIPMELGAQNVHWEKGGGLHGRGQRRDVASVAGQVRRDWPQRAQAVVWRKRRAPWVKRWPPLCRRAYIPSFAWVRAYPNATRTGWKKS